MARLLVLYHSPADTATFDSHYQQVHIPLAQALPGLRSYTINAEPLISPAGTPAYHLVAALDFDSVADIQTALDSPEGRAALGDLENFAQAGVTVLMFETRAA